MKFNDGDDVKRFVYIALSLKDKECRMLSKEIRQIQHSFKQ